MPGIGIVLRRAFFRKENVEHDGFWGFHEFSAIRVSAARLIDTTHIEQMSKNLRQIFRLNIQ